MLRKGSLFLFIKLAFCLHAYAVESLVCYSPDGKLCLHVEPNSDGFLANASLLGKHLFDWSAHGYQKANKDSMRLRYLSAEESSYYEKRKNVWGERDSAQSAYHELTLHYLDENSKVEVTYSLRAYDAGFAYRVYVHDSANANWQRELGRISFVDAKTVWWLWADYNTLEKSYQVTRLPDAQHVALPFTLKRTDGVCLAYEEAALDDYPMMTLRRDVLDSTSFQINLVPWADGVALRTNGVFQSPWRVVQVAETEKNLLASSLLDDLNAPCAIQDVSWIKPISFCGIWWEMHLGLSDWKYTGGRHGASTSNAKRYIDFAAANGIGGVLMEGWNTGWERWGEPDAFDFTKSYPDLDLPAVVRYARSKGVEIIGHHETGGDVVMYEKQMEKAFAYYQQLGIKYVKTGYAGPVNPPTENHHGQYMVNHMNLVMRTAAKYHLMVDAHEPVIPSGLSRTWPNLLSFEAVRGMEWNAWSEGNTPSHDCILPFTRGLAGPMDYTPGIFDVLEMSHKAERLKWNSLDKGDSRVHSTICHQLAMPMIYYTPMLMLPDLPENYSGHPLFKYLKQIPATWDETRIVAASIGEFVVIARRSGTRWFVGGISNEDARVIPVSFGFLKDKQSHSYSLCSDGKEADFITRPLSYTIEQGKLRANDSLKIKLATGGGFFMIIE